MSAHTGKVGSSRRRKSLESRLYDLLGHEWAGSTVPPGDHLNMRLRDYGRDDRGREVYYVAATSNDGFDLWLGKSYEWDTFMSAPEARRLALFILWRWWARGTWFGLRRRLWYWLLRRRIARHHARLTPLSPEHDGGK